MQTNIFMISAKIVAKIISIPARLKGMKFGKNSYIGPGYDCVFNQMKNITIGNNVTIGKNAWMQTVENGQINIGDGTHIGRGFSIAARKKILIGQKCLISFNVSILDIDHQFDNLKLAPVESGLTKGKEIIIDDGCFIGAHSFILKGTRLGKYCIVGANSVVTKSFPPYTVVAGNPAKFITSRK